jgi:hypothetical protein
LKKRLNFYNASDKKIISLDDFLETILMASISHQIIAEYYDLSQYTNEIGILQGSTEKIFGFPTKSIDINCTGEFSLTEQQLKSAQSKFQSTYIYDLCKVLYEYAVLGEPMKHHWIDVIEDVDPYLQNISGADYSFLSDKVRVILDLARLRLYLDEPDYCDEITKEFDLFQVIALMAQLDERTVKNAYSQGLFSGNTGDLDNQALSLWLKSKRSYIPTKGQSVSSDFEIKNVHTSDEFAALLVAQRDKLGKLFNIKVFQTQHFLFTKNTTHELESGFFNLPLNVIPILANAYLLNEKELLDCVMRVFFPKELVSIRDVNQ